MPDPPDPPDPPQGVTWSSLDDLLFEGAGATKRDLVAYLAAMADRMVPVLRARQLSVIRVHRGQQAFMQKNLPGYAPEWIRTVTVHSQAAHRDVRYALCEDRDTLLWFANQRAVEYHVPLYRGEAWDSPTHLVLDLDPPQGDVFAAAAQAAVLVREVLTGAGMAAAVKASGAKGVHVYVPLVAGTAGGDAAAAARAVAARAQRLDPALTTTAFLRDEREGKVFLDSTRSGGATVVAAYSPRLRPGTPVSFPLAWDDLDGYDPREVTVRSAVELLAGHDPWLDLMPEPQTLDPGLVAEGHEIPIARVAAMHAGKRRARAQRGG